MAMADFNGSSINKAQVARVSPVLSIDTNIIEQDGRSYTKKYYYKLFAAGEIYESAMFNTEAEAEADRADFTAGM